MNDHADEKAIDQASDQADDQATELSGGCFCGAVRYRARGYPGEAYYCHCTICQKTSGAPAEIAVPLVADSLEYTRGEPRFFSTSPFGRRGFCADCGSRLVWVSPQHADWLNVSVGSLDDPASVIPTAHLCVDSRLPWYDAGPDLPTTRIDENTDLVEEWARAGLDHEGNALKADS